MSRAFPQSIWIGFSPGSEVAASCNHSSGAPLQKSSCQVSHEHLTLSSTGQTLCPDLQRKKVKSNHLPKVKLPLSSLKEEANSGSQLAPGFRCLLRGSHFLAPRLPVLPQRGAPGPPLEERASAANHGPPPPPFSMRGDAPAGLVRRLLPRLRDAADWPAVITGTLQEGGGAGAAPREHKLCKYPGAARG